MPQQKTILETGIPTSNNNFANSLVCTYILSVMAASLAEFVTYPLDLTKTRLQIQGEIANKLDAKIVRSPHRGMIHTMVGIVREEGLFKLWQGVSPAFFRHVIYSGTRMVTYESLRKNLVTSTDGSFPVWKSALCGVTAGCVGQFLANPTDLVKVQMQMEGKRRLLGHPPRVHGMVHAFRKIIKKSGVRGLWKGAVPNVQRAALVNMGDLTTYDTAKQFILRNTKMKDDHFTHTLASGAAGLVAAVMATPADVIKTRIMNQPTNKDGRGALYKGSVDCFRQTVSNEGFFSLYKGFLPIWIRLAPWSLTFWLSFEELRRILRVTQFN